MGNFRAPRLELVGKRLNGGLGDRFGRGKRPGDIGCDQANFARLHVYLLIESQDHRRRRAGELSMLVPSVPDVQCPTYSYILRCDLRGVAQSIREPAVHENKAAEQSLPIGMCCGITVVFRHHGKFPASNLQRRH